ncbi:uncharacterized protein FPRO_14973 [Fusarium proliferatum ET1]|uniref:Uncharacterized protein n=1 Tax=Fusarium proliferatum (strain ET1) TaxID=1227346 RepID=A0A1L7W0K5_FUSPR|nr:uncharacterized protein FPRO_14973 [Fusarium proliferatum ET1]CZR45851.1 uncharacterized protein FPRO_14973 [Fusarium proliferatum ET1]
MEKSDKIATSTHGITSYQMLRWATGNGKSDPWSPVSSIAGFQPADITLSINYTEVQKESTKATAGSTTSQK